MQQFTTRERTWKEMALLHYSLIVDCCVCVFLFYIAGPFVSVIAEVVTGVRDLDYIGLIICAAMSGLGITAVYHVAFCGFRSRGLTAVCLAGMMLVLLAFDLHVRGEIARLLTYYQWLLAAAIALIGLEPIFIRSKSTCGESEDSRLVMFFLRKVIAPMANLVGLLWIAFELVVLVWTFTLMCTVFLPAEIVSLISQFAFDAPDTMENVWKNQGISAGLWNYAKEAFMTSITLAFAVSFHLSLRLSDSDHPRVVRYPHQSHWAGFLCGVLCYAVVALVDGCFARLPDSVYLIPYIVYFVMFGFMRIGGLLVPDQRVLVRVKNDKVMAFGTHEIVFPTPG